MTMRRICVFAGSRPGTRPDYTAAAEALGRELAHRGLGLVYGGGSLGLMGAVADAALAAGGEMIGVMPRGLFRRELAHSGVTELREVGSMHERKALMADLSDAVVALPGGMGTFDELFEIVTWAQIGIHTKPIGLLDVASYFRPLVALVDHAIAEGFVAAPDGTLMLCQTDPGVLLDQMASTREPLATTRGERPPEG
ncbi:MAG: TIGR00730 family Rossman fold protein [Chloroflexota bacterium]